MKHIVRVWDAPTRLFHWCLTACVLAAVITAQIGGGAMEWHFRLGYGVLVLLAFRVIWGFAGGHWSRFATFVLSPSRILDYLSGRGTTTWIGHNPMGSVSVLTLMGLLLVQVLTGLMSDDEIAWTGPLVQHISSEWAELATFYHKDIGQWLLIAMVAIHVAAILFYLLNKGDNLVRPMVTGDKLLAQPALQSADGGKERIRALIIFLSCIAAVYAGVLWLG